MSPSTPDRYNLIFGAVPDVPDSIMSCFTHFFLLNLSFEFPSISCNDGTTEFLKMMTTISLSYICIFVFYTYLHPILLQHAVAGR